MNNSFNGSNAVDALQLKRNFTRLSKDKQNHKLADELNGIDLINETTFITNLFMSRFRWKSEEFNVSNDYIERVLFYNGLCAFYNDKNLGWLILPCTITGWNVYNEPSELTLNGNNYNETIPYSVNSKDIVLLKDNPLGSTPYFFLKRYASLISDTGRSCEVYANAMKKPIYLRGSFDKQKSIEQILYNQNNNEFQVVIDESLLKENSDGDREINFFQSDHNSNDLKGLYMHKRSLYDEMLSKIGIQSVTTHKAAQVSTDEVNKNDMMADIVLYQAKECRDEAVRKIIEISGKNIICESVVDITKIEAAKIEETNILDEKED